MLCRFKRGSQRAGPSDQPSASGLFLAQSLIEVFSRFDSVVKELSGMTSKLDTRFDNVKYQFNSIHGEL